MIPQKIHIAIAKSMTKICQKPNGFSAPVDGERSADGESSEGSEGSVEIRLGEAAGVHKISKKRLLVSYIYIYIHEYSIYTYEYNLYIYT